MAIPYSVPTPNLRTWVFFPVFAIACLVSLAYVFARPAVYLSSALLQMEAPSNSGRFPVETAPGQRQIEKREASAPLLTEVQTLTSGALLEKVLEWLTRSNPGEAAAIGSVENLRNMLSTVPIAGTNVIELRGEGSNRELLPQILRVWIEVYSERHIDAYDQSSLVALEEARSVVQQLGQNLTAKRGAIEQFRRKFDIVSLEREENQATAQLRGLNTAFNEARSREVNSEARVNAIRESLAAGKTVQLPGDKALLATLEQRADDLRDKMKDLENDYGPKYLQIDPRYKALTANLARLEQQIERQKAANAQQALHGAEEDLTGARQTVLRLEKELATRKRDVQEFTTRFAEHTALVNEVRKLEETSDAAKQRLAQLEMEKNLAGPKVMVLSPPSLPESPLRPDYWRDAGIGVAGSLVLALLSVWFIEFFKRSGVPRPEAYTQPIIHINYPPNAMLDVVTTPTLGAPPRQLTQTIERLPRELSGPEVHALWGAASPDTRLVIAALLGGLSIEELAALRYEDLDFDANCLRVSASTARSCALREPLRQLLRERLAAGGSPVPLADKQGGALSSADLEGLIACAACDAGLTNPSEVTSDVLRHTYVAYLVRQGVRLADIGEIIGHVAPAAFREYGRLSPAGPGLTLDQIDPVFPALRQRGA